ncbi:hypothetical protein [Sphingomonas sp.]|uniref:hypothetical protein n=1 Tax=Sphingomonas sp. TaxID=28214 RepID=UPI0025D328AF|nr:hypothetical protein [Sphingomonas sp.]
MQPQLVLSIGPALMPDFMTGSLVHSILAWPIAAETHVFQRVSQELMGGALRLTMSQNYDSALSVMNEWPQVDWAQIRRRAQKPKPALCYLHTRLQHRMAASGAAIGITHQQLFGIQAVLPPGMTAPSIDQFCALIKSDVSIDDPENIEKQVWRKSLPVIHLAIAAQLMLRSRRSSGATFDPDLQDIDFYREIVKLACSIEQVVHDHPALAMTSDRMPLVRWFE